MTTRRGPMEVERFAVCDRVIVPLSGRTGTVVQKLSRNNGYRVRWDEPVFGVVEGRVSPLNMARLEGR